MSQSNTPSKVTETPTSLPPLTEFSPFPRLPPEVRRMIWELAPIPSEDSSAARRAAIHTTSNALQSTREARSALSYFPHSTIQLDKTTYNDVLKIAKFYLDETNASLIVREGLEKIEHIYLEDFPMIGVRKLFKLGSVIDKAREKYSTTKHDLQVTLGDDFLHRIGTLKYDDTRQSLMSFTRMRPTELHYNFSDKVASGVQRVKNFMPNVQASLDKYIFDCLNIHLANSTTECSVVFAATNAAIVDMTPTEKCNSSAYLTLVDAATWPTPPKLTFREIPVPSLDEESKDERQPFNSLKQLWDNHPKAPSSIELDITWIPLGAEEEAVVAQ